MKHGEAAYPGEVCIRVGVQAKPPAPGDKLGLSRSARSQKPIHGLRVNPTEGTSGWYIWAGDMSDAEDFFEPSHICHIPETCPIAGPFLSLPPGWRFLTDGEYMDVWFDPDLVL